jgi:hypothetical protein
VAPCRSQSPNRSNTTGIAPPGASKIRGRGSATATTPDTIAYLEAENKYTDAWFADHADLVETIFGEIKSRIQETDLTAPIRDGKWWYTSRTEEGRNYPIHCRGRSAEDAASQVLLDENHEAEGRDFFSVDTFDLSNTQELLAWSADLDGGEKYTLRIRDLDTGLELPDVVHDMAWCGSAWSADDGSIFYVTANEAMRPYRVWRHDLGTLQADDTLVFEETDERFYVSLDLSRSRQWIVIDSRCKTFSEVLLIPADDPKQSPLVVTPRTEDLEYAVDHWGDRFVILTNLDAEDFRVMTAPLDRPDEWTELVAHESGRRVVATEPFADTPRDTRVVPGAAAAASALPDRRGARLRPRQRAARSRDRRQPGVGRHDVPLPIPVAHHPTDDLPRRRAHRRTDDVEADTRAGRRPVELHRDATVGAVARRHAGAGRSRASSRHPHRRHGAVPRLRLRQL